MIKRLILLFSFLLVAVSPPDMADQIAQGKVNAKDAAAYIRSLENKFDTNNALIASIYSAYCIKHGGLMSKPGQMAVLWKTEGEAYPAVVRCQDGKAARVVEPTPIP